MPSIKDLAKKKRNKTIQDSKVLTPQTPVEKDLIKSGDIQPANVQVAKPVYFYTTEAKKAYEKLLVKKDFQLINIPVDTMNGDANKYLSVIWNGVRFRLQRGEMYYIPRVIAKIIMQNIDGARIVADSVKDVALSTIGAMGVENIEVTVNDEKVL